MGRAMIALMSDPGMEEFVVSILPGAGDKFFDQKFVVGGYVGPAKKLAAMISERGGSVEVFPVIVMEVPTEAWRHAAMMRNERIASECDRAIVAWNQSSWPISDLVARMVTKQKFVSVMVDGEFKLPTGSKQKQFDPSQLGMFEVYTLQGDQDAEKQGEAEEGEAAGEAGAGQQAPAAGDATPAGPGGDQGVRQGEGLLAVDQGAVGEAPGLAQRDRGVAGGLGEAGPDHQGQA
jgi:hypothetical protein